MKRLKKYWKGFTLVELIIVITILAILATIAFVSFQNYVKDARDSNRLSTVSNVQKALELFSVKVGNYPLPDTATVYTGGSVTLQMGILGENSSELLSLREAPKDPMSQAYYVYSIGGNGRYYQIGGELERSLGAQIFTTAYADNSIPFVKGNYTLDPSLPSLIPVKSSITASGIFDPNVCFIVDKGSNSFSSTNMNCIKKKDISLKSLDSSLLGYWDMESDFMSGGINYLKDLSGNNNNATTTGTSVFPTKVSGYVGKGALMSGALIIGDDITIPFDKQITIVSVQNAYAFDNPYPRILANRHFNTCYENCYLYKDHAAYSGSCLGIDYTKEGINGFGGQILSASGGTLNYNYGASLLGATGTGTAKSFTDNRKNNLITLNTFYHTAFVFNNDIVQMYVNGKKVDETKAEGFNFIKNPADVSAKHIYIGGVSGANKTRDWNGIIDEVKFYSRALSPEEIAQQAHMAGF